MVATELGVELEEFTHEPATDTYRGRYNPETTTASMAVIAALSEVLEIEEEQLEPLQSAIDCDALNTLASRATATSVVSVTFAYAGYTVSLANDGVISLAAADHKLLDIDYTGSDTNDPQQETTHN